MFEDAIFRYLAGIDPREVLPAGENAADDVLALSGRLADIEARVTNIKARLRTENEVDALIDTVRELEGERQRAADALAEARQRAASPVGEAWGEFRSIAEALAAAPDPDAARVKLRGVLRRMLAEVWCLFLPGRGPRVAHVQVVFAGGEKFQHFVIVHRPQNVTKSREVYPAETVVRHLTTTATAGDIRLAENAEALETALTAVPAEEWDAVVPSRNQRAIRSAAHAERKVGIDARHERWAKMRAGTGKKKPMSFAAIAKAEGVSQSTVFKAINKPDGK